jgi:hypothetical protein
MPTVHLTRYRVLHAGFQLDSKQAVRQLDFEVTEDMVVNQATQRPIVAFQVQPVDDSLILNVYLNAPPHSSTAQKALIANYRFPNKGNRELRGLWFPVAAQRFRRPGPNAIYFQSRREGGGSKTPRVRIQGVVLWYNRRIVIPD